jgi:hypothetical protein
MSPLEFKPAVGAFKALKMKAWEDERRIAVTDNTNEQYQKAGPSQYWFERGCQEKHPMTAPARMVLWFILE